MVTSCSPSRRWRMGSGSYRALSRRGACLWIKDYILCVKVTYVSAARASKATRSTQLVMIGIHGDSLSMADFRVKSAIFRGPGPELGAAASTALGRIGGNMAELLMKSATVELGAYAHPRAAPLLDAGTGPADPGRHARRPALAVCPADGLIRKIADPRRPANAPG